MYYHVNESDTPEVIKIFDEFKKNKTSKNFLDNTKNMKDLMNDPALVRHILYLNEQEIIIDKDKNNYLGIFVENNYRNSADINFIKLHNFSPEVLKDIISYIDNKLKPLFIKKVTKLLVDLDQRSEFFIQWEQMFLDAGFTKCTQSSISKVITYEYLF